MKHLNKIDPTSFLYLPIIDLPDEKRFDLAVGAINGKQAKKMIDWKMRAYRRPEYFEWIESGRPVESIGTMDRYFKTMNDLLDNPLLDDLLDNIENMRKKDNENFI